MSDDAQNDRDDDDVYAAELALGLLSDDALVQGATRMRSDPAFAASVDGWQVQFSDLDAGFEEVSPPNRVKTELMAGLFGPQPSLLSRLWNSAPLWRGIAALGVAAALVVTLSGTPAPAPSGLPEAQLVTALFAPGGDVAFVTRYDAQRAVLRVTRLAGEPGPDQDLEMWFAPLPDARPVSMGVVPAESSYEIELSPELAAQMTTQAHFGISIEQEGGSPTGQPTDVLVVADTLAL